MATFQRDDATWASYAMLALLTSCYGMIGPLLPWLREALRLSYQQASYHSVAMALGVTATGLVVPKVAGALGRRGCIAVALLAMSAGLLCVCFAPALPVSLLACVIIGAALPFVVTVVPAVLTERHGALTGVAMAEANTIAYLGFLLAPAVVSATSSFGNWRWSFLPPIIGYIAFWAMTRRLDFGAVKLKPRAEKSRLPFAFWCHWLMLMVCISAELCMVVWGPSYLEAVLALPRELALWAAMVFPMGMLLGRMAVSLLLRRIGPEVLTLPALVCGAAGALVFVMAGGLALSAVGLFLAGVGMAGLYPFGITLAMQSAGPATDHAASRAALASGVAMLIAPFVIGFIADRAGLHAAFGLVPVFLLIGGLAHMAGRRV